ncbi:MAG: hypothetical protein ABSF44_13450 [Candidatus Bathyarchaeia archaeon]|jgi:polyhydroxyalkanoate synthesis regulator phasin
MRRRQDFTVQVERRICHLQRTAKVDTQGLRNRWIEELDQLFGIATSIAKGEVTKQQVDDKLQSITPKERQLWAQIAANIGMVMGNISKGYDERQFNEDLAELERQVDQVQKLLGGTEQAEGRSGTE